VREVLLQAVFAEDLSEEIAAGKLLGQVGIAQFVSDLHVLV
jgi:hypothetical protein